MAAATIMDRLRLRRLPLETERRIPKFRFEFVESAAQAPIHVEMAISKPRKPKPNGLRRKPCQAALSDGGPTSLVTKIYDHAG
jgi:hypothetical protein